MNPLRVLRFFRASRLQAKVLGIVAVSMVVAVTVSVAALTRVYGSAKELERISGEDFETQLGIVRSEVAFKAQVQEWKDVLVAGSDKDARERHWAAFLDTEK